MLRWVLNVAAAVSLVVCLAICALWVRSFYYTDQTTRLTPDKIFYEVMSGGGGVVLYRLEPNDGEVRWVRPAVTHNILGAEVIEGRLARRRPWILILLPYWLPAGFAAILPGAWILARAYRERRAAGVQRCPVCGDVLTGDAAACPSCRWAKSPAQATTAPSTMPAPAAASAAPPVPPPATALNPQPVSYRRAI
jgi:hypothetical protein